MLEISQILLPVLAAIFLLTNVVSANFFDFAKNIYDDFTSKRDTSSTCKSIEPTFSQYLYPSYGNRYNSAIVKDVAHSGVILNINLETGTYNIHKNEALCSENVKERCYKIIQEKLTENYHAPKTDGDFPYHDDDHIEHEKSSRYFNSLASMIKKKYFTFFYYCSNMSTCFTFLKLYPEQLRHKTILYATDTGRDERESNFLQNQVKTLPRTSDSLLKKTLKVFEILKGAVEISSEIANAGPTVSLEFKEHVLHSKTATGFLHLGGKFIDLLHCYEFDKNRIESCKAVSQNGKENCKSSVIVDGVEIASCVAGKRPRLHFPLNEGEDINKKHSFGQFVLNKMENFKKAVGGNVLVLRDEHMMPSLEIDSNTCQIRCFKNQSEHDCSDMKEINSIKRHNEPSIDSKNDFSRGIWFTHEGYKFSKLGANRLLIATSDAHHIFKNRVIGACHVSNQPHYELGVYYSRMHKGQLFVATPYLDFMTTGRHDLMIAPKNRNFSIVVPPSETILNGFARFMLGQDVNLSNFDIGEYSHYIEKFTKILIDSSINKVQIANWDGSKSVECDYLSVKTIKKCGFVYVERVFAHAVETDQNIVSKVYRIAPVYNHLATIAKIIVSNKGAHHLEFIKSANN